MTFTEWEMKNQDLKIRNAETCKHLISKTGANDADIP